MNKYNIVYLGIGSNIGDRIENVKKAMEYIASIPCTELIEQSSFYLTSPVGGPPQPDFINNVIEIKTSLSPETLLQFTQQIEKLIGRKKSKKRWGPRIIDIDILFYGNKIINTPNLQIPHKEIPNRLFVLQPLTQLSPKLVHPVLKITVKKMLKNKTYVTTDAH